MRKSTNGFTIVELLVVIAIIGILSTIGVLSYSRIQASTRDSQRSTKITILAEALEKFYDKNGEYPSCANMTKSANVVSTSLENMDPDVLKSPSATIGTNSIAFCDNLAAGIDAIAYVGDGSSSCLIGASCLEWTLKYREEATGNVISVTSRRNIAASNAGNISDLAVSNTSFAQASLTWAAIGSVINYSIQKATNSTFTANMTESTVANNTATVTGLSMNTKYYFRVRSNFTSSSGNWSNIANTTTLNLTAPIATATANSTSQITVNWNAITNATSYNVDMSTSSSFTSPTSVTGIVATNRAFSGLSSGIKYYFRVQSAALSFTSTWSTTTNATTTISIPATPTVAASTVGATTTFSWGAATCTGNTARYQYRYTISPSGYNSGLVATASTSVAFTSSTQGQTYTVQAQAECYSAFTASGMSAAGSASYYRIITYTLTIAAGAGGTVNASGTYNENTVQTITANASTNYAFSSWSGSTGCSGVASHTITMNAAKSCTANFTIITYTLTIAAGAGGTVNTGGTYNSGTTQTITATPGVVHSFSSWTGSTGCSGVASHTITMDTNKSCTANFTLYANWIPGIAATALAGKYVYNTDAPTTYTWANRNNGCVAPGYAPNVAEMLAIYAGKVTYGNNFQTPYYWSSEEYDSANAYMVYVYIDVSYAFSAAKFYAGSYVRCIAG